MSPRQGKVSGLVVKSGGGPTFSQVTPFALRGESISFMGRVSS